MANHEHLRILEQGVPTWNRWRAENPNVRPDLSGADCAGRDLRDIDLGHVVIDDDDIHRLRLVGANLERVNLSECRLSGAKLAHAELGNSNLRNAELTGADLSFAKLPSALLQNAQFENARLLRADLFYAWAKSACFHGASLYEAGAMGIMADRADFSGANLSEAILVGGRFEGADFSGADLRKAHFSGVAADECDFTSANLSHAHATHSRFARANFASATLYAGLFSASDFEAATFDGSDLQKSNFESANLSRATLLNVLTGTPRDPIRLSRANLSNARLDGIDLRGVDLRYGTLVQTNIAGAQLDGCRIYGVSAWDTVGAPASQTGLIISADGDKLTTDDLEVAQFLNLLVGSSRIRNVMNTVTSKTVLLLGRFAPARKAILDALRDELREYGYIAIMFDFEKAESKDFTESILVLAGLCRFIIADITNPKSSPLELQAIVPNYMTPLIPIIQEDEEPFSMFADLHIKYRDWVFKPLKYRDRDNLLRSLKRGIIKRAVERHDELTRRKQEAVSTEHADEFQDN